MERLLFSTQLIPEESAKPFVFTVEGDVSLANFDALSKTIDTYEGESFALNQAPSGSSDVAWQDNVPNIHYRWHRIRELRPGKGRPGFRQP